MNKPTAEMTLNDMVLAISIMKRTRDAILAAYTMQVYDWATNLGREVELIHSAPWTILKASYLLCRYYPLLTQPIIIWAYLGDYSQQYCLPIVRPIYILFIPMHILPHAVMLLRAYAFSGRRRPLTFLLGACFFTLCAVSVYTFYDAKTIPGFWYEALGKTGCFPSYTGTGQTQRLGIHFVTSACVDLFSLSVVVFFCSRVAFNRETLARNFVAQGLLAFVATAGVGITATALFHTNTVFANFGPPFATNLCNQIACHTIFYLKEALMKPVVLTELDGLSNSQQATARWSTVNRPETRPRWLSEFIASQEHQRSLRDRNLSWNEVTTNPTV